MFFGYNSRTVLFSVNRDIGSTIEVFNITIIGFNTAVFRVFAESINSVYIFAPVLKRLLRGNRFVFTYETVDIFLTRCNITVLDVYALVFFGRYGFRRNFVNLPE